MGGEAHGEGARVRVMPPPTDYAECLPQAKLEHPYNGWTSPSLPIDPTLALCETEAEVIHIAQEARLKINALIALTPQAACQCHLMGLPYYKIEDFFDVTAFCAADEPMLLLQSRWSDKVDDFLWKTIPDFQKYGFRPAGHYFFFLKIISDMLFRAAFGLAHLFLSSRPKQVIYFVANGTDVVHETLFFNESVYRLILPACAKEDDVALTPLPPLLRPTRPVASGLGLSRFLRSALPLPMIEILRRVKRGGLSDLLQLQSWRTESPTIVFTSMNGDIGFVMEAAQKKGLGGKLLADVVKHFQPTHEVSTDLISNLMADLWPQINAQPFFGGPFQWIGVDLRSAAETRLRFWWHTVIPAMWQTLLQSRAYFEVHRPGAVLLSSPWEPEDHGVLQAARSLGIPTVTYQHGGFEGNCEYTTYDMTDLRHTDYRLVYGDGIAAYLRKRIERCVEVRAQIVTVGSARLDALRQAPDKRTNIRRRLGIAPVEQLIAYLPTAYQYNWYMARQAYLGVPYFTLLTQVIEMLREFSRLRFVYKPFPELPLDPVTRVIEARCPNCHVVTDISVPELLKACDAFIIDIPSTGLLEALLTNKSMLVFSDSRFIALRQEARVLLQKRVTLSETPKDYLEQLRLFLSRGSFQELENVDREFLRAYGTHLDDGCSAQRAVNALQEIVQAHAPRDLKVKF